MTYSHAFSRALRRLHVLASNSDWLIVQFAAAVIVQSITLVLILKDISESKKPIARKESKSRTRKGGVCTYEKLNKNDLSSSSFPISLRERRLRPNRFCCPLFHCYTASFVSSMKHRRGFKETKFHLSLNNKQIEAGMWLSVEKIDPTLVPRLDARLQRKKRRPPLY